MLENTLEIKLNSYSLEIKGNENFIQSISFLPPTFDKKTQENENEEISPLILQCIQQLKEYFSGERKVFSIPFELNGTDFQKKVWEKLMEIPYGETISYSELAKRLGNEKVIRAAASANGKNKLAILVPCHRVIGANGSLTGYAGGLENKKKLLEFEKMNVKLPNSLF